VGRLVDGPGIKKGKIPEYKNFTIRRFHFEIICRRPARINTTFIPAVDDFLHLPAASLMDKGHGPFVGLIAAVTFHLYLFIGNGHDVSRSCFSCHMIIIVTFLRVVQSHYPAIVETALAAGR